MEQGVVEHIIFKTGEIIFSDWDDGNCAYIVRDVLFERV